MKALKELFYKETPRQKALISYGRGPEGEEVMIDITEPKRINVKAIIAFIIILPVMMLSLIHI